MKLELKKFDISTIKHDRVVVLIGKRDTGKSFLVRDLLYYHTDLPLGTVVSATEKVNRFYSKMIPSIFIHDEFTPEIVAKVRKRQELVMAQKEREKEKYGGKCNIDERAFLILDDCLYDNTWSKDKNIRFFFMNGRHINLFFIITMQFPLGVPPNLRTNIDYVFILRENYLSNRKRIYENYAGMFPTFEVFCQVMDQCTQNFECLVIDNTCKSNKLEDAVFWYKADNHEEFNLCSREYWVHSREQERIRKESGDDDTDEMYQPEHFKKKNQPIIKVKKSSKH
jgi:hypothetical protein